MTLVYFLAAGVAIALIFTLVGATTRGLMDIEVELEESSRKVWLINLANIFIASEKLAFSESGLIYRGLLDAEKIDFVQKNPDELLGEIYYPLPELAMGYDLRTVDLQSGKEWTLSKTSGATFFEQFPISIRYSENEINPGILKIGFIYPTIGIPGAMP
jgi:hypothetical protein